MADPFVAEIRIFPFNFAPRGWAWCNGQLLPISQNTALFSLIGTFYGGNGISNFALPNIQGSVPMHPGQGPGLSLHDLGETGGSDTVTLIESEIPRHSHLVKTSNEPAESNNPSGNSIAVADNLIYTNVENPNTQMREDSITPSGGDQPHNNMMPYLTYYFNIALHGVFPSRQ